MLHLLHALISVLISLVVSHRDAITSAKTVNVDQGQPVHYQITANFKPSAFTATNLPSGLSIDRSSGLIYGTFNLQVGTNDTDRTFTSTISARDTHRHSAEAKLVWHMRAAVITATPQVSPRTIRAGESVTLTPAGTSNFGEILNFEHQIIDPRSIIFDVGSGLGPRSYRPTSGPGAYRYAIVAYDRYGNWRVSSTPAPFTVLENANLLANGDFEIGSQGAPACWMPEAWTSGAVFAWTPGIGVNSTHAVTIEAALPNDAAFRQVVVVRPRQAYTVTGWIKGENVGVAQGGGTVGASLSLMDTWMHSDSFIGTFGWTKVTFDFLSGEHGTATIGCRLGYWSSLATGKVFFDDVVLTAMDNRRTSEHFAFDLEKNDTAVFSGSNYERWLAHLDAAYSKYHDLVGATPYGGERIHILSVHQYPGGWAVAGNPILWMQPYVREELMRCDLNDDWSFGILHEIGHNFDLGGWNWHPEFWANFKMYYVVESLNAKVMQRKYYIGAQLAEYYRADGADSYANTIARGRFTHDGLTYVFIRIQQQIGWEPFKRTFRFYLESRARPSRAIDNFNLFLDKLTEYGGIDVRATFLPGELAVCVNAIAAEN